MSELTITSPNFDLIVKLNIVGKLKDYDTLIVTEISTCNDSIIDHVFENIKFNKYKNEFVTNMNAKKSGIFSVVSFLYPDLPTLYDVFEKYDGDIIAYNNQHILKAKKETLTLENNTTYIVTAY